MRKWGLSTHAVILMLLLVLVGCSQRSGGGDDNAKPSGSPAEPSGTATATPADSGSASTSTPDAGSGEKVRLTVYSTIGELKNQEMMKSIGAAFTQENPNITVEFQFPGAEYENILKVKMAANDLPDVFDTHGWAVIRYGNYLADLRDESWAPNLTDTIKPVVTDKSGKVEALVLSEAKDGISYNAELLAQYGIQPPATFEELMAAADKIKTDSKGQVTPFFMSGIDNGMIGGFLDLYATSMYISPQQNQADALLDGSFDWNNWTPLAAKLLDMQKKGYINKDALTAKYTDMPKRFAQGKIAFVFGAPSFADDVYKVNPNAKIGIMPLTTMVDGDTPTFSGGERYTMGAWKDGKHLEASKKLIAFFAKPENMSTIANATKLPPGLKDIASQHEFSPYYDQFKDVRVFPYFDRVYLPNGMWDVMCKTGTSLVSGQTTPAQFSEKMKQEYVRLRKQA
ncbi:extracellular solute-binding protein [Cohnella nanjingensis]|uniref:Extracellular solute-binding protein n=1 Tax=Cohnella nanjingensis TaxID=1387779 RepID=A0A7X0RW59_9BACL|nr:extracellular solute-binding protein [Cohnella nanjingensis]MBB6674721.1 extracellular solute-binding protein [Cohnella nanjingensis]